MNTEVIPTGPPANIANYRQLRFNFVCRYSGKLGVVLAAVAARKKYQKMFLAI